jgi:hypothetical protein
MRDFVGVCFNAAFGNDVPQEFPPGYSKGAFFWVQLNVEPPKVVEGFFKIRDEVLALSAFYHDIIDVNLEVTPYLPLKQNCIHRWYVAPVFFRPNGIFT